MNNKPKVYRKVGVFQALETYELENGAWFKNNETSTPSIAELINDWAEAKEVEVVSISQPSINYLQWDAEKRLIRTAVSIIYIPAELIEEVELHDSAKQAREVNIPRTPEEILNLLGTNPPGAGLPRQSNLFGNS